MKLNEKIIVPMINKFLSYETVSIEKTQKTFNIGFSRDCRFVEVLIIKEFVEDEQYYAEKRRLIKRTFSLNVLFIFKHGSFCY